MSSSVKAQCSICSTLFYSTDDLVTTTCGHTYHRMCAQKRRDERQKTDCCVCGKESALGEALDQDKIKAGVLCSICQNPLDPKDDLVTIECRHTYHRSCVQHRYDDTQKTNCRVCGMESALSKTLDRNISTTKAKCPICEEYCGEKDEPITTKCGHTYHRICAQKRRDESKKTNCRACGKESALGEALDQNTETIERQCSVCGNSLDPRGDLATTACGHACHRTCAESRPNTRSRRDCRVCHNDSTREETLNRNRTSTKSTKTGQLHPGQLESDKYVKMATTTKGSDTTEKKKNHWKCQGCSIKQEEASTRCTSCGKARCRIPNPDSVVRDKVVTVEEEYKQSTSSITDQKDNAYKPFKSLDKIDPSLDSSPPVSPCSISDESSGSSSEKRSKRLEQQQRPGETSKTSSSTAAQYPSSEKKSRIGTITSTTQTQFQSNPEHEAIVYISDLPFEIEDNMQLENTIRHRLSIVLSIQSIDIKCYSNFGIGYLRVQNNQVKEHLVKTVGKIAWDSRPDSIMIAFRDTIELVSYIVFERTDENKDIDFPKSEEIIRRWMDYYNGEMPLVCNQLNIQYPNIYRVISKSLDELLRIASKPEFIIKNRSARVYPCADCRFFEGLPISTTENQLRDLICKTIGSNKNSSSSLYIQLNKQMNTACIIAIGTARKWTEQDSVCLDHQFIRKRKTLSYHLLLRPVRHKDEIDAIIRHQIFGGKAKVSNYFGQNLILKIYDKNIYENCLNSKTLHISRDLILSITIYTGTPNPNTKEIDGDSWYDTEMLQSQSNIMSFIQHLDHKIFHLKWNASIWIEQFQRINALQKQESRHNDDQQKQEHVLANNIRHLLRVTVMLNTLAVIRNKTYSIDDHDVPLNLNNKLTTILYNHQSKLKYSGPLPIKRTPYKTTEVKVMNEDCLVAYENLVHQGKRPLLLNMASATSPGGGYRKGDGAQEENLFRRSDYFRSLDINLDKFETPSPRSYCTSTCKLNIIDDPRKIYPIDEYGAIYTSGLTVFRQTEEKGYEFMKEPLTDVCSLAIAAYRHPRLDGNMLAPKYAVGMRKKIENIFSIAYHHKHDSLVLSAFGCGAFRNPPDSVAKIFRSVIEQYAGFFRLIVFAIIDDHNAGLNFNPEGNFLPFQREFERSIFEAIQPTNQPNTIFGPYRFLSDGLNVSDVSICDSTPCKFGAKCRDIDDLTHTRQYSHPPLCTEACITGTCTQMDDIVHVCSFIHRNICPHGGQCRDIEDRKHAREFEHPSYCPNGGNCQDTTDNHEREYRHLPLCKNAHKCEDYRNRSRHHCDAYRHCTPYCQYGRYCPYFHDRQHMEDNQHPFPQPCPWTPYHCVLYDEFAQSSDRDKLPDRIKQHCLDFAHVCQLGRNCLEQNSLHWKTTIHVPRSICPLDKECSKLDQDNHLNSFTHTNIRDIRYLCKNGSICEQSDHIEHKARYRHELIAKNDTIIPFCDLNKNINFFQNQKENILRIMNYIQHEERTSFTLDSIPDNMINWIRTIQPIYQCRSELFELILFHERVMSWKYIENLKNPKFLAHFILQHNRIKSIKNLKVETCEEHLQNYITALINDIYYNHQLIKTNSNDQQHIIQKEMNFLLKYISQDDINLIHQITNEIAKASINFHKNSIDVNHSSDMKFKTNKHVLSILGTCLNSNAGDIVIIFKRDILHHVDSNFSVQTSASYLTGDCYKSQPWLGSDPNSEDERIKLFRQTKLHASIPGYEKAVALQLIALINNSSHKRPMNINLQDLINNSSQNIIEARLPQIIPFDYIDQIYMTKNIYDSFNDDIRHKMDTIFGHCLTILSKNSNEEYYRYIIDTLIRQFNKYDIQSSQGFVLTIPSTNFLDKLVLPLKISQVYEYYTMHHSKTSPDMIVYIYWQVTNGDMMLTLSNEEINSDQAEPTMPCLSCYIAEKPLTTANQYKENPSYLKLDQTSVNKSRYVAKSSSFYLGCNLDNLMTFCLEIQPSSGIVKLSHVGSNSIYNHQTISYKFSRSDIDLSKLEFVHLSAGTRNVSIRNLFVTFEKQNDLHPKIDFKSEKISTNKSPTKPIASSFVIDDDQAKQSYGVIDRVKNKANQIVDRGIDYFGGKKTPSLIPCSYGINCLFQFSHNGSSHNSKYSHPCRFAELCRDYEPHLTHEPRGATACILDQKCKLLIDPYHRARYRHSSLPYFLVPCKYQLKCRDKTEKHRIKYSHGEQVLDTMGKLPSKESSKASSQYDDRVQLTPCKWGTACPDIANPRHCNKYNHHIASVQKEENNRSFRRSNSEYSDYDSNH